MHTSDVLTYNRASRWLVASYYIIEHFAMHKAILTMFEIIASNKLMCYVAIAHLEWLINNIFVLQDDYEG